MQPDNNISGDNLKFYSEEFESHKTGNLNIIKNQNK